MCAKSRSPFYVLAATFTTAPSRPQTGGGRRGPTDIRDFGGGGGGERGDDAPDYGERLRRYRFGLALAAVVIVLMFVGVSSAFVARSELKRWDPATNTYVRDWQPIKLPLKLLAFNSVVLLLSSVSIELARRQAAERAALAPVLAMPGISAGPRRPIPWLAISGILGLGFLAGQALAWHELVRHGLDISDVPASAAFYILTATHAAHLAGGLIALLYAGATTTLLHKTDDTRRIAVDITAWYWHMMAALWLYLFAVLALA